MSFHSLFRSHTLLVLPHWRTPFTTRGLSLGVSNHSFNLSQSCAYRYYPRFPAEISSRQTHFPGDFQCKNTLFPNSMDNIKKIFVPDAKSILKNREGLIPLRLYFRENQKQTYKWKETNVLSMRARQWK